MGFLSVAALLLVAGEIQLNATVAAEARAGQGPLLSGTAPRAGIIGVLTPVGEIELRRPELEMRLDYGPRIFWRQPNGLGSCPSGAPVDCPLTDRSSRLSPLVLHTANFQARGRPTRTMTVTAAATGSIGEPDYSILPMLFGTQGTLTLPTVVEILSAQARVGAMVRANRIWEYGMAMEFSHRRPLGQSTAVPPPIAPDPTMPPPLVYRLPAQTAVRVDPSATARLSRRDDLLLISGVSYQTYSTGPAYLTLTALAGWRSRLTPRYDLRILAGVAYLKSLGTPDPLATTAQTPDPFSPIGEAEFHGRILRGNSLALHAALGARVDYFVNPILALAVPQGTLTARCFVLFRQDWEAAVEAAFGTSLSAQPLPMNPDETVVAVNVPIRHRLSDHLVMEFGLRWTDRARHLRGPDFDFHQRQLWAYVMLTATTREIIRWIGPEVSPTETRRPPRAP